MGDLVHPFELMPQETFEGHLYTALEDPTGEFKGFWICPDPDGMMTGDTVPLQSAKGLISFTMDCRVLVLNEGYEANVRG